MRLGLNDQISNILNFHGFLDFLNTNVYGSNLVKLSSKSTNFNYIQDPELLIDLIDEKYQKYISLNPISPDENGNIYSKSLHLKDNNSPYVVVRGEDSGKVKFLTVSQCNFCIKKENIKIKSIGLLDGVTISEHSKSISTDYALVSSFLFTNNNNNNNNNRRFSNQEIIKAVDNNQKKVNSDLNRLYNFKFKKFSIWSSNGEIGPCKLNFSKKSVKVTYGRENSSICKPNLTTELVDFPFQPPNIGQFFGRPAEFEIPLSLFENQLSFIAPLSSSVVLNILNI